MFWEKCELENIRFIECSAFQNKNIKNVFEEIVSITIREQMLQTVLRSKRR